MNNSEHIPTTEELKQLEADPVWSLLDEASSQKASPMFVDSIMSEINAELPDNVVTSPSFWKRFSLTISAAAVAGVAASVMMTLSSNDPMADNPGAMAQSDIGFSDEDIAFITNEMPFTEELELQTTATTTEIDVLAEQMIEIDNEDPFFMSADDIDVLVTM